MKSITLRQMSASSSRRQRKAIDCVFESMESRQMLSGFSAGDLVIYRVNNGTTATSASVSVNLDEYTSGGSSVQSIALPTTSGSGNPLTAAGNASSEGNLSVSGDGRYLIVPGYATTVGTLNVPGTTLTGAYTSTSITGATNASPIVITAANAQYIKDGARVTIASVVGNTSANGSYYAKALTATTFSLYTDSALTLPLAGNGAYTSGGTLVINSGGVAVSRIAARVDSSGSIDTTTVFNGQFSSGNIRGAASTDGSTIYATGSVTGLVSQTFGSSSGSTLVTTSPTTNLRAAEAYNGVIYVSTASGTTRIMSLGGSTLATLPGIGVYNATTNPTGINGPYQFTFASLSGTTNPDTLYIADNGNNKVAKFSLIGGTWMPEGTVAVAGSITGITCKTISSTNVQLFVTSPTTLYSLTDTSGAGGTLAAATTVNTLATAATGTSFRGIALAPALTTQGSPTITGLTPPSTTVSTGGQPITLTANGIREIVGAGSISKVDFYLQLGGLPNPATDTNVGTVNNPTSLNVTQGITAPSAVGDYTYYAIVTDNANATTSAATATTVVHVINAPVISSLSPTAGPLAAGTRVVITGSNFLSASAVNFGSNSAVSFTVDSPTQITAYAPAGSTAGPVNVTVTQGIASSPVIYTYAAVPTVTSLSQTLSYTGGGTSVVITGTGFIAGTTVSFDSLAGTNVVVNSATQITVTAPAHAPGVANVTVTTAGGTSTSLPIIYASTIAAAETVATGTPVTLTNVVVSAVLDVNAQFSNNSFLIDDGTGSMDVFRAPNSYMPAVGDVITITGNYSPYQQLQELGTPFTITKISSGTYTTTPPVVHIPDFGTLPLSTGTGIASRLVTLQGVNISLTGNPSTFGTANLSGTVYDTAGHSMNLYYVPGNYSVASTNLSTLTVPVLGTPLVDITGLVDVTGSGSSAKAEFQPISMVSTTIAPVVSSVSPAAGSIAGGTSVTISGYVFTGATAVSFGLFPATSFTVVNDNTITAVTPAQGIGNVDVKVTSPTNGTSLISTGDVFNYTDAPFINSVSPQGGLNTGGDTVTIHGSNFTNTSTVNFGATAATSVTYIDPNTLRATTPNHAPGQVDIQVIDGSKFSLPTAGDKFTFAVAPSVTGLTPASGFTKGGVSVVITGTGFFASNVTAVSFGGTPATSFTITSDTQITAVSPAHTLATLGTADIVDVQVTTPLGTSPQVAADRFTYNPFTIAELESENLSTGTLVTLDSNPVITQILSTPSVVNGYTYPASSFVIQDTTGSMVIYGILPGNYTPVVGNTITVTGDWRPYHSIPEMGGTRADGTSGINAISTTGTADINALGYLPLGKTIAQVNAAVQSTDVPTQNTILGHMVTLTNVSLTPPTAGWGTGTFGSQVLQGTIADGTGTSDSMTFYYWPSSYSVANQFFYGLSIPSPTTVVSSMTGFVSIFPGNPKLYEFTPIYEPGVQERFSMTNNATNTGAADGFKQVGRGSSVTVTVTRAETDLTDTGTVDYTVIPASATPGVDYTVDYVGSKGTLTFNSGETTKTFTITTLSPSTVGDKIFSIQLSNPTGGLNRLPAIYGNQASFVIRDTSTSQTLSKSSYQENASVQPTGPYHNPNTSTSVPDTGLTQITVSKTGNGGATASFGVITYNDGNPDTGDPSHVFNLGGNALNSINSIVLETAAAPSSLLASGPLNVYLVSDTNTSIANTSNTATPPVPDSPLRFLPTTTDGTHPVADPTGEGVGSQLGAKFLLGTINYNKFQNPDVYTAYNLTNLDPTGVAMLKSALKSGGKFRIVIAAGTGTVAGFQGSNAINEALLLSPIIRFNYSSTFPAWLDPTSVANWDANTHTLSVTGAAKIIADPGSDNPAIVDTSTGIIEINGGITVTNVGSISGTGTLLIDAGANLTASSIAQTSLTVNGTLTMLDKAHGGNQIELGSVDASGNTTTAGVLTIARNGSNIFTGKIDLADRLMMIHYTQSSTTPALSDGPVDTIIDPALAQGRNVATGGVFDGPWTGSSGIVSSTAAQQFAAAHVATGSPNTEFYALGYGDTGKMTLQDGTITNKMLIDDAGSSFFDPAANGGRGAGIGSTVFLRYTRVGDATMDGIVGNNDVTVLGLNFDPTYNPAGTSPRHWYDGNFNYNGIVDNNDVTILGLQFDPTNTTAVPTVAQAATPAVSQATTPAAPQVTTSSQVVAASSGAPAVVAAFSVAPISSPADTANADSVLGATDNSLTGLFYSPSAKVLA